MSAAPAAASSTSESTNDRDSANPIVNDAERDHGAHERAADRGGPAGAAR